MVAQQTAIWVVFSVCGLAVVTRGWNEGYSRKVCHVVMYLMPFLMHMVWPKQDGNDGASSNSQLPTVWVMSWTVWFQVRLGAFPNIRHCLPCTAYVTFTAVLALVTASASLTTTWPAPHSRLFTHCTKIAQHSRLKTDQILSTPSSFLSTCRLNQRGDEARS